jgi:flagellar biosynthesis protein FlhA
MPASVVQATGVGSREGGNAAFLASKGRGAPEPRRPNRAGDAAGGGIVWKEVAVPLAVLGIVLAMIMPVPPFVVDVLISANITLSVVVLMVAMYITKPVEFSVFPTALLLMTLFRLALNISSSRLILLEGNTGTAAAGKVIEAFGNFVVGGNYVIGVVIFLVLIAIQYVVINHGAVRISEVTARFTLDAMPGKQMSIDSDLNAGLIDEAEARARRRALAAEAEFYGAMDGATRFTQRDALASILITTINIVAGFLIGVLQHEMDLSRALATYTVLTIGDGLVTVIPALMISICGGLIVTRAGSESRLSSEVGRQIFAKEQPLMLASGVLAVMALFPGLPAIPFLILASAVGSAAWRLRKSRAMALSGMEPAPHKAPRENLETLLKVDPLTLEVGLGLVRLVEGGTNSAMLRRIAGIRRQLAAELGYLVPPVRVTDNISLKAREYVVSLKGVEIGRYELPPGMELAIPPAGEAPAIEGIRTTEPAFGISAVWILSAQAEQAKAAGCTVVDQVSVIGTHLAEIIRCHAHELFSRQDAKKLLDRVAEENPKAVEDLVPKLLPLAVVQRVLQNLLRERVSIRDAVSIVEALGEAAAITRNPVLLTEYVRQATRRMVVKPYLNASGQLPAWFFDADLEQMVEGAVEHAEHSSHLNLAPQRIRELVERVQKSAGAAETPVAALCSSGVRYLLRQVLEASYPNLYLLSHNEIPPGVKVVSLGVIR